LARSDDVAHISLHHFDQFFCDWGGVVHAGAHIDLDDPRVQILVDHEIVAHHFEKTLFTGHTPFAAFYTPDYNTFHFVLNYLPFLESDVVDKSLHFPHTLIDNCIFVVFLDGVVGQMHKFVVNVIKRILIATKTKVAFFIEPYNWRVEIFDQHPLADVEFFTVYEKRVFDVFLNDKLTIFSQAVVGNIVQIVKTFDASAS
jgi:hypothetical protein